MVHIFPGILNLLRFIPDGDFLAVLQNKSSGFSIAHSKKHNHSKGDPFSIKTLLLPKPFDGCISTGTGIFS